MQLTFPLIIINCKAYEKGIGRHAVKLSQTCARISKQTGICIAIAVQAADIHAVSHSARIPVLAQHVDFIDYGAHTGSVLAEVVSQAGACGTLINHSEKPVHTKELATTIARCKTAKLTSIVCVKTPKEAFNAAAFGADIIAIEDSSLIASTTSITQKKPDLIEKILDAVPVTPVVCGAGIHTPEDIAHAIMLGTKGVLVANAVINAKNQEKMLMNMARKMRQNE